MSESINRTQIRHDTLHALAAGKVTILVYLVLRTGAVRAVDLFEERGLVEGGTGTWSLTDAGRSLLAEWDQARAGGAR